MQIDRQRLLSKVAFVTVISTLALFQAIDAGRGESLPDRAPLIIAPMLEGIFICKEAGEDKNIATADGAVEYCLGHRLNAAPLIEHALDDLEPGGAKGQVQVGYMATLPLLSLWEKKGDSWQINTTKVDMYVDLIETIKRPVVVYLAGDHFDTTGPLSEFLAKNAENLALLSNGAAPASKYFGFQVLPYTLLTDEAIPVNFYRYEALRYVAKRLLAMSEAAQKRIVAITLAGEVHQMFPNFEVATGTYQDIRVTDYSPKSIEQFRDWLRQKYLTVQKFNEAMQMAYRNFEEVSAPSKDIRKETLKSFGEHYDAFASGDLPISGWLWDPQHRVQSFDLYVDKQRLGPVPMGFDRLDVYRAEPGVESPNVGFRIDLDYRSYPAGHHLIELVADSDRQKFDIWKVEFVVVGRDQGAVPPLPAFPDNFKDAKDLHGVRYWLDLPKQLQDVLYNPLAKEWDEFRGVQVYQFLGKFYDVARQTGLPADKLYSHQIVPEANSTWNPILFASDQTLQPSVPWRPGLNMYGGATNSAWMQNFLKQRGFKEYGVPEFNPQQWKQPDVAFKALEFQYKEGAKFVSPYYLSVVPSRFKSSDSSGATPQKMELRPDNSEEGSDQFYRAIQKFSAN